MMMQQLKMHNVGDGIIMRFGYVQVVHFLDYPWEQLYLHKMVVGEKMIQDMLVVEYVVVNVWYVVYDGVFHDDLSYIVLDDDDDDGLLLVVVKVDLRIVQEEDDVRNVVIMEKEQGKRKKMHDVWQKMVQAILLDQLVHYQRNVYAVVACS